MTKWTVLNFSFLPVIPKERTQGKLLCEAMQKETTKETLMSGDGSDGRYCINDGDDCNDNDQHFIIFVLFFLNFD